MHGECSDLCKARNYSARHRGYYMRHVVDAHLASLINRVSCRVTLNFPWLHNCHEANRRGRASARARSAERDILIFANYTTEINREIDGGRTAGKYAGACTREVPRRTGISLRDAYSISQLIHRWRASNFRRQRASLDRHSRSLAARTNARWNSWSLPGVTCYKFIIIEDSRTFFLERTLSHSSHFLSPSLCFSVVTIESCLCTRVAFILVVVPELTSAISKWLFIALISNAMTRRWYFLFFISVWMNNYNDLERIESKTDLEGITKGHVD